MKFEIEKTDGLSTGQQLAKVIISTAVGFTASKLTEKLFMTVIERRRDIAAIIQS